MPGCPDGQRPTKCGDVAAFAHYITVRQRTVTRSYRFVIDNRVMDGDRRRFLYVTATIAHPTTPTMASLQARLTPLLGNRFTLIKPMGELRRFGPAPWHTFLATDTRLRRNVVLRIAVLESGDARDLHDQVRRARHAARMNAPLVAQIYDAIIDAHPSLIAPPTATAVVISEYFEGETLRSALERGATLDQAELLTGLTRRIADATEAGVSFGRLRTDDVVLTSRGPAIVRLPIGSVSAIGPTSIDSLAARLRVTPLGRVVRRVRRASLRLAHSA